MDSLKVSISSTMDDKVNSRPLYAVAKLQRSHPVVIRLAPSFDFQETVKYMLTNDRFSVT